MSSYTKTVWEDYPSTNTPITATRLNHMEDGIYEAYEHGGRGETLPVGSEIDYDGNTVPTGWEQIDNVLWTNSSPTSSMSANTEITLSSNNYDYLIWIYCYNNSSSNINIQKSTICLKGESAMLNIIAYATGNRNRRVMDYVNDTKYTARVGKTEDNSDDANVCIPLYVIGCKF